MNFNKNVSNANLPLAKYPNYPRKGVIGIDWDLVNEDRPGEKLDRKTEWEPGYGPEGKIDVETGEILKAGGSMFKVKKVKKNKFKK